MARKNKITSLTPLIFHQVMKIFKKIMRGKNTKGREEMVTDQKTRGKIREEKDHPSQCKE